MNIKALSHAIVIAWYRLGLVIEKIDEAEDQITLHTSVPESSYHVNEDGNMMAGEFLADRLKCVLTEHGVKHLTVVNKIRKDDHWTAEKANLAEETVKQKLFRP